MSICHKCRYRMNNKDLCLMKDIRSSIQLKELKDALSYDKCDDFKENDGI